MRNTQSLFDNKEEAWEKASIENIGSYFNNRLKSIFAKVSSKPGVLRNSVNNPLFLLCFAASNENGAPIACRIANHLLEKI